MAVNSPSRVSRGLLESWRGPSRTTRLVEFKRYCLQGEVEMTGLVNWEGEEVGAI